MERGKSGSVKVTFEFKAKIDTTQEYNFVANIQDVLCIVHNNELSIHDTLNLTLVNGSTGIDGTNDSIIASGSNAWINRTGANFSSLECELVIIMRDKQYKYYETFDLPAISEEQYSRMVMKATPFLDEVTDSTITFALLAERLRPVNDDYHPNSEKFRVEIFNAKGALVFNSNFGMNYMQMISHVEPYRVSEKKRFEYLWDGKGNNKLPLPAGKYKAVLTMVVKPISYGAEIEFDWKGSQK